MNLSGSSTVKTIFKKFISDSSGATAIEYALIATLISVAIIGGATSMGAATNNSLKYAADAFPAT